MKYNKDLLNTWQGQYVIALIFILTLFFLFFENSNILFVLLPLGLIGLFFYSSFNQLLRITKYLLNNHITFYKMNKGYRKYNDIQLIAVPLVGFLEDVKKLEDNVASEMAYNYKLTTNSMLIVFLVMVFFEILLVV